MALECGRALEAEAEDIRENRIRPWFSTCVGLTSSSFATENARFLLVPVPVPVVVGVVGGAEPLFLGDRDRDRGPLDSGDEARGRKSCFVR
jgi:hypothetical protein